MKFKALKIFNFSVHVLASEIKFTIHFLNSPIARRLAVDW